MSGDVQPRKRKDKRKKKEGTSLGNIHEPIPTPKFKGRSFEEDSEPAPVIGSIDPGEKIHVHNEHGIGGNICVKIIFFCLLGALVAVVGIIFIHSRGSTDVDLPSVEDSRFADYFTGWLDDPTDDHGHDEHEVAHGDDNGHDEEDDEHGGGEEEEHSAEEATEKSEEEEHGDDAAKEGSPEADDNEEENADDDEEEDEDDDEKGVDEDDEDGDEPKFKVVHRFKHFFNQRKRQRVRSTSEESDMRQKRKVIQIEDVDDEEGKKVVVKRNDLRKKWEQDEMKGSVTWKRRGRQNEAMRKRSRKEVEIVNEQTDIEDEDKEKEESGQNVKEESDEDLKEVDDGEDENEEESSEDVKDADDDMKDSDEDDEPDEEDLEEVNEKREDSDEDVKEAEDEEDEGEEESGEDVKEADEEVPETDEGDRDDKDDNSLGDEEDNDEDKSPEVSLGLNEIDESEEALEEEEKFLQAEEPPSREEETIVNDQEVDEVESKILDIEEKLNQILREKRKKVEQRKMELEEIEMESAVETTIGEEDGKDDGDEYDEVYSHGVAVKVVVGIALIVVAHLVLIKKWNSLGSLPPHEKTQANEAKEVKGEDDGGGATEPVISRRQTLVPEATDLNEYFADEGDEEIGEEEEGDEEEEEEEEIEEDVEEDEEEDEEEEEEEEYSEEEILVKDGRKWTLDYPKRLTNLSRDEDYTGEEEDEEELEEEEEEEDVEEDDYSWKRLESAKMEVEEEVEAPPIPPPRRSHMASGERRGGPQGIDDFANINEAFEELWDGYDSADQGEDQPPSGEREQEEEEKRAQVKSEDEIYKEEFRFAEDQLDNNPTASLKKYELVLSQNPESVKALTGRAKALDKIAEKERSNQYLREAINAYRILLTKHVKSLPEREFLLLSERCIDRMRFRGFFKSAVDIHKGLIEKFPDNPKYRNDLAVTYLFLNDIESARSLLSETLKIWPKNGFALVHYGFVLKTADNNHAEAVDYLMAGIRSREPGVIDGRFFFHLGDALNRLGRGKEAMEWYDRGVKEGLFLSKYQRSLYNINRLKAQPWWTQKETTYQDFFKKLEDSWEKIRSEGLTLLNSKGVNLFKEEAENLKEIGDWRQLDLYFRGTRHANCERAPFTCSLIASFPPASTCTRGQVKFSVMLPSTHVWPHCGPTNCRLRSHLGLVVPKNTFIRVAEETRSWEEGKVMVFDDSFEHEVWHNGTGVRLVLIVDVWHPELTPKERSFLSPI